MSLGVNKPVLRLPPAPTGYKAFQRWTIAAIRRIAAYAGISLQIDGADSMSIGSDGGFLAKITSGSGAGTRPLQSILVSELTLQVLTGTILGAMPTISGTRLDASSPPTLTAPSSGTRYVVATITGTPVTTTITT
jgi:hypothetical protein